MKLSDDYTPNFGLTRTIELILDSNFCPDLHDSLLELIHPARMASKILTMEMLDAELKQLTEKKAQLDTSLAEAQTRETVLYTKIAALESERANAEKAVQAMRQAATFFQTPDLSGWKKPHLFTEDEDVVALFKTRSDYDYTDDLITSFLMALSTTQIITLHGKPGSGKTTFVYEAAKAIGTTVTIISVQNNWTDSADLMGYYNPMQKTFESTEFTEAILAAKDEYDAP